MGADVADGATDLHWMGQALALAALGEGATSPNPRVGCVLVRDGRVVGHGYHRGPGSPHAEAIAVSAAGERARGATLYVNLEPCAHHGRTPPCVPRLIAAGVRCVVAAVVDPNPLVNGRGFRGLQRAGVELRVGTGSAAARRLNADFFSRHERGRPWVTVKAAPSLDGQLAAAGGASRWISGPAARRFAHRLRLASDAVLVGAGTVRRDDPQLTVRLPGVAAQPRRAVLAPRLGLDPRAAIFERRRAEDAPTRVYVGAELPEGVGASLATRARVVRVGTQDGRLDLEAVLRDLLEDGAQSILVEGGGKTIAGFLDARLADRAALFLTPRLLGARGATPLVDRAAVSDPARGWRIEPIHRVPLGEDLLLLGSVIYPEAEPGPAATGE